MIRKALLLLFAFSMIGGRLWAEPVTTEQAAQKAKRFMTAKKGQVELKQATAYGAAASRNYADASEPLLYIFNVGKDEGFIIVSGEDSTPEVLAYTEQGSYDYDLLPDNAKTWIDGYARQIEALRQSGVQTADEAVELHEAIAPLLTCQWNQDAPFNNACPQFVNGAQSVTGCVATAMAQVLYYHRDCSVPVLQAAIPAYHCGTNWDGVGRISVNGVADGSIIDWDNMLDKYDASATDIQKKAVADLMFYCGVSVEMDYRDARNGGSGASDTSIPVALKKYFGYSETATVKLRKYFTADNWDRLIYRELMNGRPVIFSGQSSAGGHAFVCDGYAEDGMFHFNWGWGGLADGYYLITDLRPSGQGIGGGGSAYNNDVSVVIGMKPGDGTPYEEDMRLTVTEFSNPVTHTVKSSSGVVTFDYEYYVQNHTTSTRTFEIALALYENGQFKETLTGTNRGEIAKNATVKLFSTSPLYKTLGIGTYQVKVVSRLSGTTKWQESIDADKWYIEIIVEEDQISYVRHQLEEPEVILGIDTDPEPEPEPEPEPDPEPEGIDINAVNFPDENFRTYLLAQDYGQDSLLIDAEVQDITEMDVAGKSISSLEGIEYFSVLTLLNCSRNQIEEVAMDTLISRLPQGVADGGSKLYVYDNTASDEGNVCTKEQVAAAKSKGWTPYYYDGTEWLEYTGIDDVVETPDDSVGIEDVKVAGNGTVHIYTLSGQKVSRVAAGRKGIYIVDGKKVIVK